MIVNEPRMRRKYNFIWSNIWALLVKINKFLRPFGSKPAKLDKKVVLVVSVVFNYKLSLLL